MQRARLAVIFCALISAFLAVGPQFRAAQAAAPPANDNLVNAITVTTPLTSGVVASGNNTNATLQSGESAPCGSIGSTVWFNWTSPASTGTITFDTYGSSFDTVLAIYTGGSFPLTSVACNDDRATPRSGATIPYAASTTYRIQVGGSGTNSGTFVLSISTGAEMIVTSAQDSNMADADLTLREAMLLATGGTSATGLNRLLTPEETALMLNPSAAGSTSSDIIRFKPLASAIAISPTLPELSGTGDNISGIEASPVIDGVTNTLTCLSVTAPRTIFEGLQVKHCLYGLIMMSGSSTIGGSSIAAQSNTFSANNTGIELRSADNLVTGNRIGTDVTGMTAAGNVKGLWLDLSSNHNLISDNVISGNTNYGILLDGSTVTANTITGNIFGANATGAAPLPNGIGVSILNYAHDNVIGEAPPAEQNVFAYNSSAALIISGQAVNNAVRYNSIYSNAAGIDNQSGGNREITPPVITSVGGGPASVNGIACGGCTVDVYGDAGTQGRVYLASGQAATSGFFTISLAGVGHELPNITATAVDATGDTSEFSAAFASAPDLDADGTPDASDLCLAVPEDFDGFQDTDGCPDYDNDQDGVCDAHFGGVPAGVGCTGVDRGYFAFDPAMTIAGSYPLSPTLIDCSDLPEDRDGFHDADGCPDPDNDNDGHPDVSDACPGTDTQTGPDNMLGAPQDLNHNGFKDTSEALFTTDDSVLVFEDWDGVIDSDGCHDSPGDDFDGDSFGAMSGGMPSFRDEREVFLGTDPMHGCAATATANDEPSPDAWPVDFNDDQKVTLADVLQMRPVFNTPAAYATRYDFNADGSITLADVLVFRPFFNTTCVR